MPKGPAVPVSRLPIQTGTGPQLSRRAAPVRPGRLDSIDLLRGLAMVVMALDHVRDFFINVRFDPLDLSQTTPYLFLTRWITHHCAPAFVFLAGTGAFLYLMRGRTRGDLARFLLSRGLWLVFLELTVVRFAWLFNLDYSFAFVQVIWVIGWSMVALSGLIFLPRLGLALVSLGMIALHNLTDTVEPASFGPFAWLWQILHVQSPITWGTENVLFVIYPLIPWIGVMGAGYLFGSIVLQEEGVRRRKMYTIGFTLIAGFIFLRAVNIYGDPHPWAVQDSLLTTFLSFLDTHKYPPSLLYLMMTLGPAIAILPFLERWEGKAANFITVFGRVPLFYYVFHLYLIHVLALIAARHQLGTFRFLTSNIPFENFPANYGFSLGTVYLVWIAVIFLLYLPCRWFARVKRKSNNPLLSYL
ncbi:DUF1624 domain-containing protein [bacterium]|nr:MAG: DUF1624 domain-containing protein [bacterium]